MQRLIDKYFRGETSLEEEEALHAYFQGDEVEERHLKYQSLFQFFGKKKAEEVSEGFNQRLGSRLRKSNRPSNLQAWKSRILRIAAVFILAMGAWFVYQNTVQPSAKSPEEIWAANEIKDPDKALAATKAALLFASRKLNSGTKKATKGVVKINKVSKYFKSPD